MPSGSSLHHARHPSRRAGLRVRAAVAFGLTALVLDVTLSGLAYGLVRTYLLHERESAAMRQAYTNARLVRTGLRSAEPEIPRLLSGLQVGPAGSSLLRYRERWFTNSVETSRDVVPRRLRALVEEGHAARQKVRVEGDPFVVVGVPITEAGAVYYESTGLADVDRTLDLLASSLLAAGAAATATAVVVGLSASRALLRPLRRMALVSRRIVDGDLDSELDDGGDSDLAPLVASFNEMLDDLKSRIEQEARFASDVSHELRGPLTALAAAVDVVARRRQELPDQVVSAVDVLDRQVRSFNQLVVDLLEISRFDVGAAQLELRRLPLPDFVRSVLDGLGHSRVPVTVTDGAPTVIMADPRRFQQIIANLVQNADRYAGGVTCVEILSRNGLVAVAVCDRGPGVAAHERDVIFSRFSRGAVAEQPDAPKGTGLGLALVAEHVRLHGGRVCAEDNPGGGARFVVEIPVGAA